MIHTTATALLATVPLMTTTTDADIVSGAATGVFLLVFLVTFAVSYVVSVLPLWGIFRKAGNPEVPAWGAWVPIYNTYLLCKLVGRPGWWLVLFFVPGVNVVMLIIVMNDLARSFGYGTAFTVGLVLLSVIFYYVLWLDSSRYRGPAALVGPPTYA